LRGQPILLKLHRRARLQPLMHHLHAHTHALKPESAPAQIPPCLMARIASRRVTRGKASRGEAMRAEGTISRSSSARPILSARTSASCEAYSFTAVRRSARHSHETRPSTCLIR
jgi:hypothetical protein